jgi:hypothetical protein
LASDFASASVMPGPIDRHLTDDRLGFSSTPTTTSGCPGSIGSGVAFASRAVGGAL